MLKKGIHLIFVLSTVCGLFVTICDYLVQMTTTETDYFVSRILSLDNISVVLSSYGCMFTFPFWISGVYLIYLTMRRVNQSLALLCSVGVGYSLLMLAYFHYSYAMVFNIGNTQADWSLLTKANTPLYPFMFVLLPICWLVIGMSNFSSKSVISGWTILVNPVLLTMIFSIITWIYPSAQILQPGIFSLGITFYYVICWMQLKKRNSCVERRS